MNETEQKVVKWLYEDLTGRSSSAIAYEFLLGDQAERYPHYPVDCRDLCRCLELVRQIPETREAVTRLATKSRYWAALNRHWETLRDMLSQETGGRMVYPWAKRTNAAMMEIIGKVSSGHDLPDITPIGFNCAEGQHEIVPAGGALNPQGRK